MENRVREHLLFSAVGDGPCRVLRKLSYAEGCSKVASGLCERKYDCNSGELIGFRMLARAPQGESAFNAHSSQSAISNREMDSFVTESSSTADLDEVERAERVLNGRSAEDRVERLRAKVLVWPMVGPARGDILRAWPRERS